MWRRRKVGSVDRRNRRPGDRASRPGRNLILAGAVLVIALIAGAAWLVLDRRAADMAAAEREIDGLSVALAEQTNLTFGAVDSVLHDLLDQIHAAGVSTPEGLAALVANQEMHLRLRDRVAGLGQMDVASIAGANGRLLNFSRRWPVPETPLNDRDYFRALRDDPAREYSIGAPVASRGTGLLTIYLARRIEAPDGHFLGIVLGAVRLDYFANLYRAVSEGDGRSVALQRRDGVLLARYPETGVPLGTIPRNSGVVRDMPGSVRVARWLGPSPVTGQVLLRVGRAVGDYPLVVVVGRTEASILAGWRSQALGVGGGAALAGLALMVATTLLARQLAARAVSEATLAVTLDHMDQGILSVDADHRVQVYNRRFLQMLDLPAELLAARPVFADILRFQWDRGDFGPDGANLDPANRAFVELGGLTNEPHSYERRRDDGTTIAITSLPLPDGGLVRTYSDVTAARTRETALQAALAARDDAEHKLRQHSQEIEAVLAERTRPLAVSEARHRDMTDVASDWIWETDASGCLTFLSKRFGDTSGIPWAAVTGRPLDGLVQLGFDRDHMRDLTAIMQAGNSFQDQVCRIGLHDGRTRFWMLSGKPFSDADTGAFAGYRGTGTDVTIKMGREAALSAALLRAEEAERTAKAATTRLMEAIEAIPEGFVLHDADDRMVLCNARYAEFYDLDGESRAPGAWFADALRRSAYRSLGAAARPDEIEAEIAQRLERHRAIDGNRELQHQANGRWLEVHERRTSDGGTVGIRIDVTEARLREAAERDRAKLAALGHLAGGVAHEINNLLQPALGVADLVRDSLPPDDTDAHEALDAVLDSTRKMREIVRNILLFARKEEPRLTPLDLVAELRASLGFVSQLIPPSVTIVERGLDCYLGCLVAANKTQLTQVLTNLLVNAVQAMAGPGTVVVSVEKIEPPPDDAVELAIEAGRPYLAVSIADTGCGMDEATRTRIFEPFFTTKPIGQGTGLGLSVAYGILRSWHGAISVQSVVGEGTTFALYIPVMEGG
jgi:signal transduction histidine kinase